MRKVFVIISYLLLISITALLYKIENRFAGLFLIGGHLLFTLFWLVKGVRYVIKRNRLIGLIYILLAFLFLGLASKMEYQYYSIFNILIPLLGLLIIELTQRAKIRNEQLLFNIRQAGLIALILIFISDRQILGFLNISLKPFSEKSISWSDFRGEIDPNSKLNRSIVVGYRYKIKRIGKHPKGIALSGMYPDSSWIKEIGDQDELMSENNFARIFEIGVRKSRKVMSEQSLTRPELVDSIKSIYLSTKEIGKDYQSELAKYNDRETLLKWDEFINKELEKLSDFK